MRDSMSSTDGSVGQSLSTLNSTYCKYHHIGHSKPGPCLSQTFSDLKTRLERLLTGISATSSIYTAVLVKQNNVAKMSELEQVYGWVAFAAFNIIWASSLQFIRRRYYEAFYLIHVAMFIVAVVMLGLHKPKKFKESSIAIGSIWIFDRVIRHIKQIYYSYNTTATLIPLSGMATKVVLSRKVHTLPGSHAFLSIPAIRKFQSHPFTISSCNNVEFVIKAQNGFTLDLHKYALKNPNTKVRAFFDGPYGAVPDFRRFNKVVLFAGGSGGAFSFPIAMDIAMHAGKCNVTHVEFVWVIKDERKYPQSNPPLCFTCYRPRAFPCDGPAKVLVETVVMWSSFYYRQSIQLIHP